MEFAISSLADHLLPQTCLRNIIHDTEEEESAKRYTKCMSQSR